MSANGRQRGSIGKRCVFHTYKVFKFSSTSDPLQFTSPLERVFCFDRKSERSDLWLSDREHLNCESNRC